MEWLKWTKISQSNQRTEEWVISACPLKSLPRRSVWAEGVAAWSPSGRTPENPEMDRFGVQVRHFRDDLRHETGRLRISFSTRPPQSSDFRRGADFLKNWKTEILIICSGSSIHDGGCFIHFMKWKTVKKKWTSFSEFQVFSSPESHVLDIGNTENTHVMKDRKNKCGSCQVFSSSVWPP